MSSKSKKHSSSSSSSKKNISKSKKYIRKSIKETDNENEQSMQPKYIYYINMILYLFLENNLNFYVRLNIKIGYLNLR